MMKCAWVCVASLSPLACLEQKAASQADPSTKKSLLLSFRPACLGMSTLRALTTPKWARVHATVRALSPPLAVIRQCQVWPQLCPLVVPAVLLGTCRAAFFEAFLRTNGRGLLGPKKVERSHLRLFALCGTPSKSSAWQEPLTWEVWAGISRW